MRLGRSAVLVVGLVAGLCGADAYAGQAPKPATQTGPETAPPREQPPPPQEPTAKPGDDQSAGTEHGEAGTRMFGVLPNYTTIEHATDVQPIGAGRKFQMAALNSFDPYVYPFVAVVAAVDVRYGSGPSAYAKQYFASFADNSIGNFMTTAVMPSLLHLDPRYFQRGTGSGPSRVAYAASRILVTRSDAGRTRFNASEVAGNAAAAALSNVYYPTVERTAAATLSRWGMQLMWDGLANEMKEFWPDVRRKLHRK